MENTVAVIGAGNGGLAMAAYLASRGASVNLCDPFPQYLEGTQKAGYIELTYRGESSRQVLNMVTADIAAAVSGVRLLLVVTPSYTHKIIAGQCAGVLGDGRIVVLNPGRTGGALEFLNTIRSKGCQSDVTIAEAQTLIYSCRKSGENAVEIYGVKKSVDLGAIPSDRAQSVADVLRPYYPQFNPVKNCLQTSLSNVGALFHPSPVLLNIGRIENDTRGFRHYRDGITPSVAGLIKAIDRERIAVADAYGLEILSGEEWLKNSYETYGDSLYELVQHYEAYGEIMSPNTIQSRYVTEDVPMSLVPISELGKIADVPTVNIDAVITLTSSIYQTDFRSEGRSVKNLGLEGMNRSQVINYFETGIPQK